MIALCDHVLTPPSSNAVTFSLIGTVSTFSIENCEVVSICLKDSKVVDSNSFATVAAVPLHCLSR